MNVMSALEWEPVPIGCHIGKLIDIHRQSRIGHQAGFCHYTYVWNVNGHKIFQTSKVELDFVIGEEKLLHVEWGSIAKPCNNPLWMWA